MWGGKGKGKAARKSDPAKRERPSKDVKDPHASDPHSFQMAHRRLAWAFKLVSTICICLIFVVISLTLAISELIPLQKTRVALIKADPADDRVFEVLPVASGTDGFALAIESVARNFTRDLLEIDSTTQKVRWTRARLHTTSGFWSSWTDIHTPRVQGALNDGLRREIVIETAHQLEAYTNEWLVAVDFRQIDRYKDEIHDNEARRAYIRLETRPQSVPESQRFDNPLGIRVIDMTVKRHASGN